MHGAVLDLSGEVRTRRSTAVAGREGESAVEALLETCAATLVAAATMPVLGVGVGSPGVIDPSGSVLEAPNRGWFDLPLADRLSADLGVPVHVANDANTAALGEYTYGGASDSLLVLTVGEGVGAGIVLDGALVQGHQHAAGELGHVTAVDERRHRRRPPPQPAPAAGGAAWRRCCPCPRCGAGSRVWTPPPPRSLSRRSAGASASRSPRS